MYKARVILTSTAYENEQISRISVEKNSKFSAEVAPLPTCTPGYFFRISNMACEPNPGGPLFPSLHFCLIPSSLKIWHHGSNKFKDFPENQMTKFYAEFGNKWMVQNIELRLPLTVPNHKLKSALTCTVWSQCTPVTDRQTDRWTNIMTIARRFVLTNASRAKNQGGAQIKRSGRISTQRG